ncbi:MAG TPA: dehydrogenase [Desulfotomaculum sp.]|nr:MAG: dehydrogenase [Desulfotomaculum sp. BICA1-6]HBX22754.1 dehydrogenase [Desulfotomaculum sp.]
MSEKKAHQEITAKLRAECKRLLETGTVHTVIGFAPGSMPDRTVPVFITNPQEVAQLTWNPFCAANLSKYLLDHHQPGGKAAIVVKGCDSRGIVRLLQDNQVLRDEVHILGIPCRGQYDHRKIPAGLDVRATEPPEQETADVAHPELRLEKCAYCENPTPVIYDLLLDDAVAPSTDSSGRFTEITDLEAKTAQEKSAYWDDHFSRCLRCYACRNACPACTCRECVFDQFDPDWVSKRNNLTENTAFHLIRAFHVAGRCVDCGECDRVCPVQIPLRLLNRKIIKDLDELFEAPTPGTDINVKPALGDFTPQDPDEFH